jgi:hypothetical protein
LVMFSLLIEANFKEWLFAEGVLHELGFVMLTVAEDQVAKLWWFTWGGVWDLGLHHIYISQTSVKFSVIDEATICCYFDDNSLSCSDYDNFKKYDVISSHFVMMGDDLLKGLQRLRKDGLIWNKVRNEALQWTNNTIYTYYNHSLMAYFLIYWAIFWWVVFCGVGWCFRCNQQFRIPPSYSRTGWFYPCFSFYRRWGTDLVPPPWLKCWVRLEPIVDL